MRKVILAALPGVLLAAGCTSMDGPEPITVPAQAFRPIERADQAFATPNQAVDHYLRLDGMTGVETTTRIGTDPEGRADRILLFSTDGYADDSVQGEQWRIEFDETDRGYLVVNAGKRYKCYRGPNAGEWQRQLCP